MFPTGSQEVIGSIPFTSTNKITGLREIVALFLCPKSVQGDNRVTTVQHIDVIDSVFG